MKQLINSISVELKLLIRNKINYILVIVSAYFLYASIKERLQDLTLSGYVVQILILGSMLAGYNIFNKEKYEGCDELFNSIGNIKMKYYGKIIAGIIYVLSINLILIVITTFYGLWLGEYNIVIKEAVLYNILYFGLPSMISLIVGAIISLSIKGKLGYAILVLISFIIGPLNMQIYEMITGILGHSTLTKAVSLLNLGQYDINMGFDSLYGFEIESLRFLHHFIYFQVVLLVLGFIFFIKERRDRRNLTISILSLILLISISLYNYNKPSFIYKSGRAEPESKNRYDTYFYMNKKLTYTEKYFKIKSVNINLETEKDLKVNGTFTIELTEDTDRIVATLYRDFKIKHVKLDDKMLSIKQEGDNFEIYLDKKYLKGEVIPLQMDYEGTSSQYFYAGEKAILLPSYFAWLPYPGKTLAMHYNAIVRSTPLLHENAVEYEIKCNRTKNVGSNLNVDGDTLKGTTTGGVTLISGLLNKKDINGIRYYYTLDCNEEYLDDYVKELVKNINDIEEIISVNKSTVNTVMFAPIKREVLGITQVKTMKQGNTIISALKPEKTIEKGSLFYEALGSILNNNLSFVLQDRKLKDIFIDEFTSWYFKKEQITEEITSGNNKVSDDSVNRVLIKIRDLSHKDKRKFFETYYQKLSEYKILTLEDVEKLF